MMVLAHIMGVPVEEMLTPLATGAGTGVILWLRWTIKRARSYHR
jgi:hypothetical protein